MSNEDLKVLKNMPDLSKFKLIHGKERMDESRVCLVGFYSVVPGCFSSLETIYQFSQKKEVYTLLITIDTEEKMKQYLGESN